MFQGVHVYPKQSSQNSENGIHLITLQSSGIEEYIIFLKYISKNTYR
jgi:hypothetical protein